MKKILIGTSYQILNKIVTAGTTFLITVIIVRLYGGATFGEYSVIINYIMFFYLLSDFGFLPYIVKEFSEDDKYAKTNFAKILFFRLIFSTIVVLIAYALLGFLPYSDNIKAIISVGLILIPIQSITSTCTYVFQSYFKYYGILFANIIGSIILILGVYLLASNVNSEILESILYITILSSFAVAIISLLLTKDYIALRDRLFDLKFFKKLLNESYIYGFTLLVNTIMVHADRLILSAYRPPIEVGYYSLAYKIFDLMLIVPAFLMNAAYPLLVTLYSKNKPEFINTYKKILYILTGVSITFTLGVLYVGRSAINTIWGIEMLNAYPLLMILALSTLVFFITSPLSSLYIIINQKGKLLYMYILGMVVNISLGFLLIPSYGSVGAAYITVLTEVVVLTMMVLWLIYTRGYRAIR